MHSEDCRAPSISEGSGPSPLPRVRHVCYGCMFLFYTTNKCTNICQVKHRKSENERAGLMASIGNSITGPKFYETDEVMYIENFDPAAFLRTLAVVRQKEVLSGSTRITIAEP